MDRTRRLSELIMARHPDAFGSDFEKNKKALEELTVITSKQLRNEIAGYIAKMKEDATEQEAQSEEQRA